ncbi:MAG: metallophosphoesterase family protein [Acidimicrobiales bacterium]
MVRFLHTGDWQLGMTRHFLDADAQAVFTRSRLDAVRTIGRLADEHACEFVVVAGDVFESNHVARPVVVGALAAMGAHPGVRWYLLPGNHDPLDAASVFRSPTFCRHRPDNVVVLDTPGPVDVGDGVRLVAAPWVSKRPLTDLVNEAVEQVDRRDGTLGIVVGHGAVDALSPDRTDPAVISLDDLHRAIEADLVHYVALGDRHSTTSVGPTGRVRYAGAPEPTDHVETDPGHVLLVELDPGGCAVTSLDVGTWRFVEHRADLTSRADVERLGAWLAGHADPARTVVRLSLVGHLSLADAAVLDATLDHHRDLLAALVTWERHSDLAIVPDPADVEHLDLTGFARDTFDDLVASATGGSPEATEALALLHRLAASP